ncbi:MAG: ABC transporter permease [Vicinamibacterales bacterium]
MTRFLVQRLLQSLVLLVLVIAAVFLIFQVMPGDITTVMVSPETPPEARQAVIERLGLDRPVHERFAIYMRGLVQFDLGAAFPTASFHGGQPVTAIIAERLPRTVLLFVVVVVVNYALGFAIGKRIAWRRGGIAELLPTAIGVVLHNVFTPVAGLVLLWLFALRFGLFPFGGWQDFTRWRPFIERGLTSNDVFVPMIGTGAFFVAWTLLLLRSTSGMDRPSMRRAARAAGFAVFVVGALVWWQRTALLPLALDVLYHMTLPVLALVLIGFATPMLVMRDSMLETMRDDFVLTARAKGLPDRQVRDRHAARAALLPIATSFALAVALVVDGAVITETLFSWPGMGQALLRSVTEKNYPVTMGVVIVAGTTVLLAHLIVDLLYAAIDPRVRHA